MMKKFTVALVLAVGLSLVFANYAMADTCLIEFMGDCLVWISI